MCMMLTMLPMSAMAAEDKDLDLENGKWDVQGDVSTYKLEADTEVKTVKAEAGEYTLNLDTYKLTTNGFEVGADSSLEIDASANSKGVYAITKDVNFMLTGAVTIKDNVIFGSPVVMAGSKTKAIADKSTLSGTYQEGLTFNNATATLKDAKIEGEVVIDETSTVTLEGTVELAKDITVAGTLIYADGAVVEGEGKVITEAGGEVSVGTDTAPFDFTITNNGTVSVYQFVNDTYVIVADVSATSKVNLPKDAKARLNFSNTVDTLKIDEVDVTKDITSDNTYRVDNDTAGRKIAVDFHRSSSGGGGGGSSGYSVNVASTTNGTVTVSPKNAAKGATVTVTVKPNTGYVLDTLTVTDKDGKTVDLTDKGDNKYTFVMPAGSVTVKATFKVAPKTPFTDVAESAWYADAVAYAYENGMMKGTSDTKFSPEQTTTRGMIVTILYRLEKEPTASASSFTDVAAGKYYSKAVAWASANKIVTGYGDGKFGPDDTITREQMAAILYRYASYKGYDVTKTADLSKFTDASQVGVFAKAAMQWANAEGLINGTSTTKLSPKSGATRAEVATILMRFCENIAK